MKKVLFLVALVLTPIVLSGCAKKCEVEPIVAENIVLHEESITELEDETGEKLRSIGGEFGVTTGRPRRCGWFDAISAKYSVLVGGLSEVALTKLDVLDSFEEVAHQSDILISAVTPKNSLTVA